MSEKNVKAVKRETRRMMKWYLSQFEDYLKPKPKYWPWWVWEWVQGKVLRLDKIKPQILAKKKI